MTDVKKPKGSVIDAFVAGAKNGMYIAINSTIPNIVMAFALIHVLNVTGVLGFLETAFAPVMGIFGLPGAGAAVVMAGFMSMGGGIGTAMALFSNGYLEMEHLPIVMMSIYIMGSQVQFIGRVIGTAGVPSKYVPHMLLINLILAFIGMFVMNILT